MSTPSWTHPEYQKIVTLLSARTGLKFRPDQRESVESGVRRVMARFEPMELEQFTALLQGDNGALNDLIAELTVGETYFFREMEQFERIRREVFPEIRRRRGLDHTIRIWSAGCASGEEAYSVAILCEQCGISRHSDILATDISEVALAKARRAEFRRWSLRGPGASIAENYLTLRDSRYCLKRRIADRVRFEFLNLALDLYPSRATSTMGVDLILCRNVMIYFDRDTVKAVAGRLFDSLSEGGWLITASGDPSLSGLAGFETSVTSRGMFYRKPVLKTDLSSNDWNPPTQLDVPEQPVDNSLDDTVHGMSDTVDSRLSSSDDETVLSFPAEDSHESRALSAARDFLERGQYERTIKATEDHLSNPKACVLHLKAMANMDARRALDRSADFVRRHALVPELQYLHAVLLIEMNRDDKAAEAARRAVFLDHSLAAAHFLLGSILQRQDRLEPAMRHFRNARNLCRTRRRDERVPLTDGETAGQMATAADARLSTIKAALRRKS